MVITMKKTVLFLLVIFLVIGACGCGMKTMKNERNNIVPYLEEKYGEEFTLVSYDMRSIDVPYDEAICVNALGQKLKVYVDYEDGSTVITDNYYGTLRMPQYREVLQEIFKVIPCDFKFCTHFTAGFFDSEYDKDTPLSVALAEKKAQFFTNTFFFVPEDAEIDETMLSQIREACLAKNITMYFAVYKMDAQTYAAIDETQQGSTYIRFEDGDKPLYEITIK